MSTLQSKANVLRILKEARALIADPADWVQGMFWADRYKNPTSMSEAECYCSAGALRKVMGLLINYSNADFSSPALTLYTELIHGISVEGDIINYNDTHTHEEVLKVWDEKIATLEEEVRVETEERMLK
jgi:hypothetical protein